MKIPVFLATIAAVGAFVFSPTAQADDLKALEGTWKVVSAEAGGKPVESSDLKEVIVKITGDRYEVRTKDMTDAGTMKLDETKTPKQMDATDTEGADVGKVVKAIYELKGDSLKVCYAMEGSERPTELATKEGSPFLLLVYQREKKAE